MAWAELADPFERCAWECAKSWSILFCYHKIPDTGPLIRRQGLTGSEGALGVLRHSGWTGARRRHGQVGKRDYESWIWLLPIPIDKVTQSHKTWCPPPESFDPFPRWGSGSHLQRRSIAPQWGPVFHSISFWRTNNSGNVLPLLGFWELSPVSPMASTPWDICTCNRDSLPPLSCLGKPTFFTHCDASHNCRGFFFFFGKTLSRRKCLHLAWLNLGSPGICASVVTAFGAKSRGIFFFFLKVRQIRQKRERKGTKTWSTM